MATRKKREKVHPLFKIIDTLNDNVLNLEDYINRVEGDQQKGENTAIDTDLLHSCRQELENAVYEMWQHWEEVEQKLKEQMTVNKEGQLNETSAS